MVNAKIVALPSEDKVTKNDADKVINADNSYGKLNNEQKQLVGIELFNKLKAVSQMFKKLLLTDENTGISVTGIGGTNFNQNVNLVVNSIISENKLTQKTQEKVSTVINGRNVVELYDIYLISNNEKIQPNGNVLVKILLPPSIRANKDLQLINLKDTGEVINVNFTRDGDYLIFEANHFSKYGITVKRDITKFIVYFIVVVIVFVVTIISFIYYKNRKS